MALLYVLDSALKNGKAREEKLQDPGLAKSMQRFCNAVAAGLPALLRATQNDPPCYDKTLRVSRAVFRSRLRILRSVLRPFSLRSPAHARQTVQAQTVCLAVSAEAWSQWRSPSPSQEHPG